MSENGKLLTIREAAELAQVTPACIYKHIQQGLIEFSTVENNRRKIKQVKKQDILSFFKPETQPLKTVENGIQEFNQHVEKLIQHFDNSFQQLRTDNKTQLAPVSAIQQNMSYITKVVLSENQKLKAELETMREEEKNLIATIEELKKRLEIEESKKWYQKLF